MKFELEQKDIEAIAEICVKKLTDKAFVESAYKTSEEFAKKRLWHLFEESHAKFEVREIIGNQVEALLKQIVFKDNYLKNELYEIFKSEDFKKVSIQALKDRIRNIEREIELLNENSEDEDN